MEKTLEQKIEVLENAVEMFSSEVLSLSKQIKELQLQVKQLQEVNFKNVPVKVGRPTENKPTVEIENKFGIERECGCCKKVLPLSSFYIHKSGNYSYPVKVCRECEQNIRRIKREESAKREIKEKEKIENNPVIKKKQESKNNFVQLQTRAKEMNMSYGQYVSYLQGDKSRIELL